MRTPRAYVGSIRTDERTEKAKGGLRTDGEFFAYMFARALAGELAEDSRLQQHVSSQIDMAAFDAACKWARRRRLAPAGRGKLAKRGRCWDH